MSRGKWASTVAFVAEELVDLSLLDGRWSSKTKKHGNRVAGVPSTERSPCHPEVWKRLL